MQLICAHSPSLMRRGIDETSTGVGAQLSGFRFYISANLLTINPFFASHLTHRLQSEV